MTSSTRCLMPQTSVAKKFSGVLEIESRELPSRRKKEIVLIPQFAQDCGFICLSCRRVGAEPSQERLASVLDG